MRSQFENDTWKVARARVLSITTGSPMHVLDATALVSTSGASGSTTIAVDTINGDFDASGTLTVGSEVVAYTSVSYNQAGVATFSGLTTTAAHDVGVAVTHRRVALANRLGVRVHNDTGGTAFVGRDARVDHNAKVKGIIQADDATTAAYVDYPVDHQIDLYIDVTTTGRVGIIEYA